MHNNELSNTAIIVQKYIEEVGIRVVASLQSRIKSHRKFVGRAEVKSSRLNSYLYVDSGSIFAVEGYRFNIPQEITSNLIRSMPRRMRDVFTERGGYTHYSSFHFVVVFTFVFLNNNEMAICSINAIS